MGCDAHGSLAESVVSIPEGQDVVVAGVQPGHHHGHVIGFRAAVDKVRHLHTADALKRCVRIDILCDFRKRKLKGDTVWLHKFPVRPLVEWSVWYVQAWLSLADWTSHMHMTS